MGKSSVPYPVNSNPAGSNSNRLIKQNSSGTAKSWGLKPRKA